jgi:hypothetical protein
MQIVSVLALLLALVACVFAQKVLDAKSFEAEVGGNKDVFVKFFAPWCKFLSNHEIVPVRLRFR